MDEVRLTSVINADIDRVYEAVSKPGWYISDDEGDTTGQEMREVEGGHLLIDPRYGQFFFRTLSENPPHSTSHQCVYYPLAEFNPDLTRTDSTICEFELESIPEGTLVTASERDYHKLGMTPAETEAFIEDNARGWETKIGHLKMQLEGDEV